MTLTYEQMAAAFWLVASDLCFIFFDKGEEAKVQPIISVKYQVGPNLNDTFYYACADTEIIPWEEMVAVAEAVRALPDDNDRSWWLVDWAARKRGEEPKIPQVRAKLEEFRRRVQLRGVR